LGLGLATLEPTNGNACVETAASGVTIAGLLFDAGTKRSEYLVHVGETTNDPTNPILLADTYYRVGGAKPENTAVDTALVVDADGVVGDNLWIWRADHGDGVGWNNNTSDHGIRINGDDVTMVALMVEHFQKEQTIWSGLRGKCIMYQSEVPYDIPEGVASSSFVVEEDVTDFTGIGIGIYLYNRDAAIPLESAMTVPDAPGVRIEHIIDVMLGNSHPGIHHVINAAGGSVMHTGETQKVLQYCNGEWK
ncbi:MAG: sialidase, partial [Lachnospiraceae bacterium]|nr:sialidase [Lachnospiraceae bacterium]